MLLVVVVFEFDADEEFVEVDELVYVFEVELEEFVVDELLVELVWLEVELVDELELVVVFVEVFWLWSLDNCIEALHWFTHNSTQASLFDCSSILHLALQEEMHVETFESVSLYSCKKTGLELSCLN